MIPPKQYNFRYLPLFGVQAHRPPPVSNDGHSPGPHIDRSMSHRRIQGSGLHHREYHQYIQPFYSLISHCNAAICSTIVFAEANERSSILNAIRNRYSVAVDTISTEYRLVGEHRLQKYACFLMENYFPVHDRQAALDGELMCQYVADNATKEELELISARADRLMKKYIQIAE